jgi:hypothetical protein
MGGLKKKNDPRGTSVCKSFSSAGCFRRHHGSAQGDSKGSAKVSPASMAPGASGVPILFVCPLNAPPRAMIAFAHSARTLRGSLYEATGIHHLSWQHRCVVCRHARSNRRGCGGSPRAMADLESFAPIKAAILGDERHAEGNLPLGPVVPSFTRSCKSARSPR